MKLYHLLPPDQIRLPIVVARMDEKSKESGVTFRGRPRAEGIGIPHHMALLRLQHDEATGLAVLVRSNPVPKYCFD